MDVSDVFIAESLLPSRNFYNEILSEISLYLYCKMWIPLLMFSHNVIENTSHFYRDCCIIISYFCEDLWEFCKASPLLRSSLGHWQRQQKVTCNLSKLRIKSAFHLSLPLPVSRIKVVALNSAQFKIPNSEMLCSESNRNYISITRKVFYSK